MRALGWAVLLIGVAAGVGLFITRGNPVDPEVFAGLTPDAVNGERVFTTAGCASCHVAPDAEGGGPPILSGGKIFVTNKGRFVAPNISPDKTAGIGGWSDYEIANAIMAGLTPDGTHLYPALPYTSYNKMRPQDALDIAAHLRTLPASETIQPQSDIPFPFSIRRALGAWKQLYLSTDWALETDDPVLMRGRYLVEAVAHCGECHTPRNGLGAMRRDAWLQGAPLPSGEGRVPGITPEMLGWSEADIVEYLTSGFTPEYDSAGGEMAEVIENTSQMPQADREAIAAYLLATAN